MTPWMRKIHKWIGLLIGLQFVLWLSSGLVMSLLDHDQVQGHEYRAHASEPRPWPNDALPASAVLVGGQSSVQRVSSAWLLERPVYQAYDGQKTRLSDAMTGEAIDCLLYTSPSPRDS